MEEGEIGVDELRPSQSKIAAHDSIQRADDGSIDNAAAKSDGSKQIVSTEHRHVRSKSRRARSKRSLTRVMLLAGKDGIRSKKNGLGGVIFFCNQHTKQDCFRYGVFGLPFQKRDIVDQVVPGTFLFLFEYEARQMWGIYEAITYGGLNLEPDAFMDTPGAFPAQVCFRIHKECLPLEEHEFKKAIKDNYFTDIKFKSGLSHVQVDKLSKLFRRKSADFMIRSLIREMPLTECRDLGCLEEIHDQQWLQKNASGTADGTMYLSGEVERDALVNSEVALLPRYPMDVSSYLVPMGHSDASRRKPPSPRWSHRGDLQISYKDTDVLCLGHASASIEPHSYYLASDGVYVPCAAADNQIYGGRAHEEGTVSCMTVDNQLSQVSELRNLSIENKLSHLANLYRMKFEQEKATKVLNREVESDFSDENVSALYSDKLHRKVSVWSRISGLGKVRETVCNEESTSLRSENATRRDFHNEVIRSRGSKGTTSRDLSPQDQEDSSLCMDVNILTIEESATSDCLAEEYFIDFKRRRKPLTFCRLERSQDMQIKKRRKLTRPDFTTFDELNEQSGETLISCQLEKSQVSENSDTVHENAAQQWVWIMDNGPATDSREVGSELQLMEVVAQGPKLMENTSLSDISSDNCATNSESGSPRASNVQGKTLEYSWLQEGPTAAVKPPVCLDLDLRLSLKELTGVGSLSDNSRCANVQGNLMERKIASSNLGNMDLNLRLSLKNYID